MAGPLLCALVLLSGIWFNYRAPRTGLRVEWSGQSWTVTEPLSRLQPGDTVRRFAGSPVVFETFLMDNAFLQSSQELWSWLRLKGELYTALDSGESVPITVSREDGRTVEDRLPVSHRGWQFLREPASAHLLVGLTFLMVGWLTYRSSPGEPRVFWFYLLCLSMSLVYLTNAFSLLAEFTLAPGFLRAGNVLNIFNFVFAPALLLHFSLLMPRDRTRGWLLALIYGAAFTVFFSFQPSLQGSWVALLFVGSLLAVAQGAWSYRGALERQQMKWVGVGFLLGLGPWVLLNGLPLVLLGHRIISDMLTGACLVFIPIFMAVAVQRYRLFDVGSFLESTAVYLLTLALLVGLDILVLTLLDGKAALSEGAIVSLALLVGAYGPVRATLGRALSKLAHRETFNLREWESLVDRRLAGALPEEVIERLQLVVQEYLAPSTLQLLPGCDLPVGVHLQVEEQASVILVVAEQQAMRCGPLSGGRVYNSEVISRLEEIVKRAGLYYQAVFQARVADRERQRRLEERERLLGDLHDGVGSVLSNIRLTSSDANVSKLAGDALFELQNFLYSGPDYTISFEEFAAEMRAYGHAACGDEGPEFHLCSGSSQPTALERRVGLSLFRLLKEAVANCLKHARAENLWVELRVEGEGVDKVLMLSIKDDGKGLEATGGKGRGLDNMRTRVEELGGRLSVESEDGWHIRIKLPIGGGDS